MPRRCPQACRERATCVLAKFILRLASMNGVLHVAPAGGKTSAKAHGTMHSWSRLRSTISIFRAAPAQPVRGRRSPP